MIKYRYEEFHIKADNSFTVKALAWDSAFPEEQALITMDFASGSNVSTIESRMTNVMNSIKNLKRTEP
jgi:hypothetical protein